MTSKVDSYYVWSTLTNKGDSTWVISLKLCTITADNASNNSTMAANLEKLLKDSSSRFAKNYLTPCMAHVLNLTVQCILKEVGNEESYLDSEDDEKHIEGLEAISQKPLGEILHRLQKLIIIVNHSPKRISVVS